MKKGAEAPLLMGGLAHHPLGHFECQNGNGDQQNSAADQ